MTTAREVAEGLSEAMRRAMIANAPMGSRSSYSLRVSMATMEALAKRGLVRRVAGVGSFYSPQTAIEWPLTPLGQEVRRILKEGKDG